MRSRPIKEELIYIRQLKEELCEERIKLCRLTKTNPWNIEDLNFVLKSLKINKCREPHGLINELFKPGTIGKNLETSLLTLLNKIKSEMSIPEFMQLVNIVAIYKGKGEKSNLENKRNLYCEFIPINLDEVGLQG